MQGEMMDALPPSAPVAMVVAEAAVRPRGAVLPPHGGSAQVRPGLPSGRMEWHALEGDEGLRFGLYVPSRGTLGRPVFVSVHGISRNAEEHLAMFAPFAEAAGVVMVVPVFDRRRFPAYQRLAPNDRGERPLQVFERMIAEAVQRTGADGRRLHLFGYSGGGQFVHRYAMARPGRVAGYVVGAAGWYTHPDPQRRFPYGLRWNPALDLGSFDLEAFLRVPGWVLVGERDTRADAALRSSERVLRVQGDSRLERGRRWVEAMNAMAQSLRLQGRIGFETLRRSPHSFRRSMKRGGMGARVFELLFGYRAAAQRPLDRAA